MFAGFLCVGGVVLLWGGIPVLVKVALQYVDPFTLAFLRLAQGFLVMTVSVLARDRSFRFVFWKNAWLVIGGLGMSINYVFFALSLNFTAAGAGGLIVQFQFVVLAALAAVVLRERVPGTKIAGMLTIIAGVALVYSGRYDLDRAVGSRYAFGNSLMLLAAIGWGTYALANKAEGRTTHTLHILMPMMGIGASVTGVVAAIGFHPRAAITLSGAAAIFVLGTVCTGVGFILMSEGLKRLSASAAGPFTAVTPLLNLLFARIFLNERPPGNILVSAVLIVAGVVAVGYSEWRGRRQAMSRIPAPAQDSAPKRP